MKPYTRSQARRTHEHYALKSLHTEDKSKESHSSKVPLLNEQNFREWMLYIFFR